MNDTDVGRGYEAANKIIYQAFGEVNKPVYDRLKAGTDVATEVVTGDQKQALSKAVTALKKVINEYNINSEQNAQQNTNTKIANYKYLLGMMRAMRELMQACIAATIYKDPLKSIDSIPEAELANNEKVKDLLAKELAPFKEENAKLRSQLEELFNITKGLAEYEQNIVNQALS